MGRKFGLSFSWRRATGISAAKGKLSRAIGVPLTAAGRQRKVGRAVLGLGLGSLFLFGSRRRRAAPAADEADDRAGGVGLGRLIAVAIFAVGVFALWGRLTSKTALVEPSRTSQEPVPHHAPVSVRIVATPDTAPEPPFVVAQPVPRADLAVIRRAAAAAKLEADNPEYRVYKMHASYLKTSLEKARAAGTAAPRSVESDYARAVARMTKLEDDQMAKTK